MKKNNYIAPLCRVAHVQVPLLNPSNSISVDTGDAADRIEAGGEATPGGGNAYARDAFYDNFSDEEKFFGE